MPKWLTPELAAKLDALRESGKSIKEMASAAGISLSQSQYYNALRRKGGGKNGAAKKNEKNPETPKNGTGVVGGVQRAIDMLWEERNQHVLICDELEKAIESLKALKIGEPHE